MAQDFKILRGAGMNTDDAVELVGEDTLENYNLRVTGTAEGESGYGTNPESTSLIAGSRPTGINKAIGAAGFEITRTGYAFIYNSQLYHIISKLNYDAGTQTQVFQNLTDSAGANVLPLNPTYYVNDIKQINDYLLSWTDGNSQPCIINLTRLEAGNYGTLTLNDFLIIKAQSLIPPTCEYGDDAGQSVNLLQGKLFQFRHQLVYLDYEYSAWSTISKRPIPTSEATPAVGTDVTKNNNIVVSVDIGTDRVDTVNIAARYSNYDWFLIKSATRDYIEALPTDIDIATEVYEAYDPATNLYSIVFYNDGLYVDIDPIETDLDYDHVPLKCETLENLNGNQLGLGGITEGYARPEVEAALEVTTYDPNISTTPPVGTFTVLSTHDGRDRNNHWHNYNFIMVGTPATGDIVTVVLVNNRNTTEKITYTYTVPISQNGNLSAVGVSVAATLPSGAVNNSVSGQSQVKANTSTQTNSTQYYQLLSATVTPFNAGSAAVKSIHALKSNSSYQLALRHYDYWGRYFPLVTGKDYVMNTPSYAQSQGQTPAINWTITSDPPEGAVSAQWMITENNTHQTTLFIDGVIDVAQTNSDYLVFNISPLKNFNSKNSSSVLNYDYTPGDRCTIHFYYSSGTTPVWFNNPAVDVEVAGFEIKDNIYYYLKVRKSSSITTADILGKNVMLEVYTPKLRTVVAGGTESTEQLFFEIGERIPISNGDYETTTGTITDGDVYFKTRELAGAQDPNTLYSFKVEDFNFSDFYPSTYTSYGRPGNYSDEQGRIERKASIRYSDLFQRGSLVNGLTRFYPERIYGDGDGESSSNYGWIRKLWQRNNTLMCIQEIKVGYIPVYSTIVEDQVGQEQYALSDRIFNKIRYNESGNIGIGNAKESFAWWNNNAYFVDPFRSEPIRAGLDGVHPISGKMSMFFKRTIQAAYEAGKKLIGYYDIFNNEYLLSTETTGDIVLSIPLDVSNWQYEDTYVIPPGDITITAQGTKGVATYDNTTGIATYTPNAGQTGTDSFTFSFTPAGGVLTTKRVCITITPGSTTILPFSFLPQTGIVQSTLTESNAILVSGNTIPAAVSISGGTDKGYSINGAGFTAAAGTANDGDTIIVRQRSSASLNTSTTTTLTVNGESAPFVITTVSAVPDVDIDWTLTQDLDPYVMSGLVYLLNAVEQWRTFNNGSGTVTVPAGSTVEFRQFSYPANFPWPDNGTGVNNAQLAVLDGGTPLYNNTVQTQVIELHGANYSWVTVAGHSYTVNAQTYTNMTGFEPYAINIDSFTVDIETELVDDTTSDFVLLVEELGNTGVNSYSFNVLDDANDITANFTNNDTVQISITISGHSPLLLLPGASGSITGITKGNITVTVENVQLGVLVVDYYDDANVNVCAYIDTVGVTQSGNIVSAIGAQNFYLTTDPAVSAYMLSGDNILIARLRRRFEWNIDKLNDEYPNAGAIPTFTLQIRGRSTVAGACTGVYSQKRSSDLMTMTGSPGSYIPSVSPDSTPGVTTVWNSNVASGADGTVGTGVGSLILTFTYTRATNAISVTTY